MALYLFSDAHLGSGSPAEEADKVARIERLVDLVKADGDRLIILGDLFDFWFEYKHAIPKDHHDVLFMLRSVVKRGITLEYISGNHDFWMGDYFEDQIGAILHRDTLDTEYAGKKLHLTHGDGLAEADRGYRLLKRILRNRFNYWAYRKLPPDWAIPLAKYVSGSSRKHTVRRDPTFVPDYEAYAKAKIAEGFDIVAIGHLHIPIRKELDGGVYLNTGDFIEHFTYVRIDTDSICLKKID